MFQIKQKYKYVVDCLFKNFKKYQRFCKTSILAKDKINECFFKTSLYRSRYRSIRMDIHNNLKETVANGYLSRSYNGGRNYALWKTYFRRNFCSLPIHEDCNATRDLAYLERKGFIKIGEYDVLLEIFRKIDERAIQYIEKKTTDIKAVGKGQITPISSPRELLKRLLPNFFFFFWKYSFVKNSQNLRTRLYITMYIRWQSMKEPVNKLYKSIFCFRFVKY